jgi:hypothetical protein
MTVLFAPRQHANARVLILGHHLKVLRPVVRAITVGVMNDL